MENSDGTVVLSEPPKEVERDEGTSVLGANTDYEGTMVLSGGEGTMLLSGEEGTTVLSG